jgi:Tfp pilus assembly protein PilP
MKKALSFCLIACFLCLCTQIALSQQTKQETTQEEKQVMEKEISEIMPKKTRPTYSRAGRRDPFLDLLAQQEAVPGTGREGEPQVSVENIKVVGIVKARGQFTAIVTGVDEKEKNTPGSILILFSFPVVGICQQPILSQYR